MRHAVRATSAYTWLTSSSSIFNKCTHTYTYSYNICTHINLLKLHCLCMVNICLYTYVLIWPYMHLWFTAYLLLTAWPRAVACSSCAATLRHKHTRHIHTYIHIGVGTNRHIVIALHIPLALATQAIDWAVCHQLQWPCNHHHLLFHSTASLVSNYM